MIRGNLRGRREIATEVFYFLPVPTCYVCSENLFCFTFMCTHLSSISPTIKEEAERFVYLVLEKIAQQRFMYYSVMIFPYFLLIIS